MLRPLIEAAGFRWIKLGAERDDPELAEVRSRLDQLPGLARSRFARENLFGGILPRRLVPDVLALAEVWRPDVIVRESWELGAMIAAEVLGVPHAKVETDAAGALPFETADFFEPIRRLRAALSLPDRSVPELLDQYLALVPFPAALHTTEHPIAPTAHHVRTLPVEDPDSALPAWVAGIGSRPLIYVGLGTLYSGLFGSEIFSKLLAGLRQVDAEFVVTVGNDLDPATFGPQPDNIHLERYLPLSALLSRCALAVFHGGSGTLGLVMSHGLPMVIIPLGSDQPTNAARCAELGASRTLDQEHLTPEQIRDVVLDVLHTPGYRRAAERLRDEFNALPGPKFAVELIERLAQDKTPIIASR